MLWRLLDHSKAGLFVTVTMNPKMQLNALLDDITKKWYLWNGCCIRLRGRVPKSRSPRTYLHIILKDHWEHRNSSDYDKFVSGEIPDTELFPQHHATVTTCMIHGPCGRGISIPCTGEDGVFQTIL
ncbi:Helitron helicase [Phytophthora megakarya]|uniref:Helitron helicase n=1 Tax=Phytophthora megakarya TaxID=4795 RepID=A0A225UM50_9STRA|nr:Helitron helicase [Phytophthora megakarya]